MSRFHSEILNNLIEQLSSLPSIGQKSALRLALHLIKQPDEKIDGFISALTHVKENLKICSRCNNISDGPICNICLDPSRSDQVICVVEGIRDLIAIEETQQFSGRYFVLDGLISPIEGIGPSEIGLEKLIALLEQSSTEEVIVAISPTFEGDTTVFYLSKLLKDKSIKITTLARGVSFGSELEYTDEVTLGRSILSRVPYEDVFNKS